MRVCNPEYVGDVSVLGGIGYKLSGELIDVVEKLGI
jgi:hypothetical protein